MSYCESISCHIHRLIANQAFRPGVEIGHYSKVGHGSVVTESVLLYHYVEGNLAVVVKKFDKSIASGVDDIHFSNLLAEWEKSGWSVSRRVKLPEAEPSWQEAKRFER